MPKTYLVTYRIHNGYLYYDPKYFTTTTEMIDAASKQEAYEKALERAATPSLIAHDRVTVSKRDVRLLPNPTLNFILDHKYYELIANGPKDEEYRSINDYWVRHLFDNAVRNKTGALIGRKNIVQYTLEELRRQKRDIRNEIACGNAIPKEIKTIIFHRGYTSTRVEYPFISVTIGRGRKEWGAPDEECFIIKFKKD